MSARRLTGKLQGEARAAVIEARRQAKADAAEAKAARPSTSVERVYFVSQRLVEEGYSAQTIRCYRAEMLRGEWWCEQHGKTLLNAPGDLIAEFVAARPKSFSTRKLMRSAFGHYWRVFGRANPPLWLIRLPSKPKMICRALEEDEARTLAAHARGKGGLKAFAVLLAMYQALRREEIASLRWDCFRTDGWVGIIGKGEVSARVPVHPVIAEAMTALERPSPWVFPGRFGGHVTPATVWEWTLNLSAEAGLGHVAPHRLRHTSLATANDATGDLRAVQDFARHAEVTTTAGYTRTTTRRLIAAMEAINYDTVAPADEPDGARGRSDAEEIADLRAEVAHLRAVIRRLTSVEPAAAPGPALELVAGGQE